MELEATPHPVQRWNGEWRLETQDEADERLYGGGTLKTDELGGAIYDGIADGAEQVALNMAKLAAEQVVLAVGTPLAAKALGLLAKQGWKLFQRANGQYFIRKEIRDAKGNIKTIEWRSTGASGRARRS